MAESKNSRSYSRESKKATLIFFFISISIVIFHTWHRSQTKQGRNTLVAALPGSQVSNIGSITTDLKSGQAFLKPVHHFEMLIFLGLAS